MKNLKEKIDHPHHYNKGTIEAIEVIEDWNLDFHLGNAIKYICRAGNKSRETYKEDLKKAIWYIQRKVDGLEEKNKKKIP
tara:strand:+ start:166 stop:405 length:240 start_codon:yes stop_codon:yes gene_type:complete